MTLLLRPIMFLMVFFLYFQPLHAMNNQQNYFKNFWYPTYHTQRLNYCSLDGKTCGLSLANDYCKLIGYSRADKEIIDYNVGLTHFLSVKAQCKGWQCNGFMLIRCVGKFSPKNQPNYSYRLNHFAYPRFNNYRVDWCYENAQGCGQRAAYSFCRRMGYSRVNHYTKELSVPATKALGNQRLCFGKACSGFSSITCYR